MSLSLQEQKNIIFDILCSKTTYKYYHSELYYKVCMTDMYVKPMVIVDQQLLKSAAKVVDCI